jgi:hypothetical protein
MRRFWRFLGALSTGHWLVTAGLPFVAVVIGGTRGLFWPWLVLLAAGVFLSVLGGIFAYHYLSDPRPRLAWAGTTSLVIPREDYLVSPDGTKQPFTRRFPMTAAELGIANDPPFHRPSARLTDASLWFAFFPLEGESNEPTLETPGAWGLGPRDIEREITLPPNNQHRTFAVSFRHDGESDWYAASPDLWHHANLRIPSQKLPERFIVRVTLRGTGLMVDEIWWLEVGPPTPEAIAIKRWAGRN